MAKQNQKKNKESAKDPLLLRLDTITYLLLRKEFTSQEGKIKKGEMAKFLHSLNWPFTEIASLLGSKKATSISSLIYTKKGK